MSQVTLGYLRETHTCTRTRRNPYLWSWVRVFGGYGYGFRGYHTLYIIYLYIIYYTTLQRGADPLLPVRSKTKTRRGEHIPPHHVEMEMMTQWGGGIPLLAVLKWERHDEKGMALLITSK